jgi:ATP-dependent Clp protease ATP-binding subunit ClpC
MKPPFTDCTRSIIQQAQTEARQLNQEFIGTEHLALSLLKVHGCEAVRVLHANNVHGETVYSALLLMLPKAANPPVISGDLPLSPRSQRMVNSAIVAAQSMRQTRISTRALMLALMEEETSSFVTALRRAGADIDTLRQALQQPVEEPET